MVSIRDVRLTDGRLIRVYDTGVEEAADAPTVLWHHGSPQTGAPLEPLLSAAAARGIRLLSYGRPSYGGSSPHRGRNVASAGTDVAQIVDALGVARFAVMGAAAGGLGAASAGREARERYAVSAEFDVNSFTPADWAALNGAWASLGADSVQAGAAGPNGLIDDDLAFVAPWGFDVAQIDAPVLLVQGGQDRVVPPTHGDWLMHNCPSSELWLRPRDGHISILGAVPLAMDWLRAQYEPL